MKNLLGKLRSTRTFNVAIVTQTSIGFTLVAILFIEYITQSNILSIWKPILLVYLAYLIAVSPILSRTKSTKQRKYVTAREELVKAMKSVKTNPEDVMFYIRSAIDLSIQEKFGFQKIYPMIKFLEEAKEKNFPLPAYDLIHKYFSSGSDRIHSGTINTPFEISQITRTVKEFIDELDEITITEEEIEKFKQRCKYVK